MSTLCHRHLSLAKLWAHKILWKFVLLQNFTEMNFCASWDITTQETCSVQSRCSLPESWWSHFPLWILPFYLCILTNSENQILNCFSDLWVFSLNVVTFKWSSSTFRGQATVYLTAEAESHSFLIPKAAATVKISWLCLWQSFCIPHVGFLSSVKRDILWFLSVPSGAAVPACVCFSSAVCRWHAGNSVQRAVLSL